MRTLLFAILIAAATPALADMSDCDQFASNAEMTACAWDQYEAADKELNAVWKQVTAAVKATDTEFMPPDEVKKWLDALITSQKAWVTFKDVDCKDVIGHEWYGGSGASLAAANCLYADTVARTSDLKERYLEH